MDGVDDAGGLVHLPVTVHVDVPHHRDVDGAQSLLYLP